MIPVEDKNRVDGNNKSGTMAIVSTIVSQSLTMVRGNSLVHPHNIPVVMVIVKIK